MNRSVWTISNFLSIVRVLLVLPISFLLWSGGDEARIWTVALIIVGATTDLLDGWLARKLNQVSEFGKIIDPLADKIAIGAICSILAIRGFIPLWFFLVVIVRDLLIFIGGIYVRRSRGVILQSNYPGKWAAAVISWYILITVAVPASDFAVLKELLKIASVLMLAISSALYLYRFLLVTRRGASAA
jgi:CDP-diacylglycerol--glycerol-3-phosphate 3-phosphatidyltransferase